MSRNNICARSRSRCSDPRIVLPRAVLEAVADVEPLWRRITDSEWTSLENWLWSLARGVRRKAPVRVRRLLCSSALEDQVAAGKVIREVTDRAFEALDEEAFRRFDRLLHEIEFNGRDLWWLMRSSREFGKSRLHEQRVYRRDGRVAHPNAIHGTPITPLRVLRQLKGASFCVSYARPEQLAEVIRLAGRDGVILLDNGAFSSHTSGERLDAAHWRSYLQWAWSLVKMLPNTLAVVPDVIGGTEAENLAFAEQWAGFFHDEMERVVPVWHLHESFDYLRRLLDLGFPVVAFGSSGEYWKVGTPKWRERVWGAFDAIESHCAEEALVLPRVHMMRGLGLLKDAEFPFASADSTNIARNHSRGKAVDAGERMRRRLEASSFPVLAGTYPHSGERQASGEAVPIGEFATLAHLRAARERGGQRKLFE